MAVVADGAHSLGAERRGKRSGCFADCTTFSFHAVKNLTTAEGGAATWNPACAIGAQKEVGSIEEGKVADFILCNPDYTEKRVFLAGKELS